MEYDKQISWYQITLTGMCIDCQKPEQLNLNDSKRLHKDGGPSIIWRDGYAMWHLNGVEVSKEMAETPSSQLDPKLVLKEKNTDIQRELIRKIGPERVLKECGAKTLDDWDDPATGMKYQLMDMNLDNIQRKYLYFEHASMKDVFYAKPVPPEVTSSLQARAWILGMVEQEDLNDWSAVKEAEVIVNLPSYVS